MAILLDLIVIGIILLSTFLGYKKGLIGVAFKIISFIIAIIITLLLYKPVSNLIIENTSWDETIENTIYTKLAGTKVEEGEKINKEETDLPGIVVNYINEGIENTVKETQKNVAQIVAQNLSQSIIQIATMVIIFILTRLILLFAKVILEAVSELPLIKQFNETGGIIYGILRGFIMIFAILAIASFILPAINQTAMLGYIDKTFIIKFLYNHNIILMLFF
ncbi:MAG: CvpA family protein [Clostridia bacterium]|nr:CvpA family protein [Clostridia bacterium]